MPPGGLSTLVAAPERAALHRGWSCSALVRLLWYCAATLPRPVRHGEPAGAAQEDIGQSFASTRRKSFSLTRGSFHGGVSSARPDATTRETRFALAGRVRMGARCWLASGLSCVGLWSLLFGKCAIPLMRQPQNPAGEQAGCARPDERHRHRVRGKVQAADRDGGGIEGLLGRCEISP
jgi:hypothetical protein